MYESEYFSPMLSRSAQKDVCFLNVSTLTVDCRINHSVEQHSKLFRNFSLAHRESSLLVVLFIRIYTTAIPLRSLVQEPEKENEYRIQAQLTTSYVWFICYLLEHTDRAGEFCTSGFSVSLSTG